MRKLYLLLIALAVLACVAVASAAYVMTAPESVVVTVNPPGGWNVGPGWN